MNTRSYEGMKLLRHGQRTWPVADGKRGDGTAHKSINAAKRHVRAQKLAPGECWTVEALKRNGLQVPA